ncbi:MULTISPECIES: protease modulator HflC [Gammaproteobacteria]|uniref:protease modulator HflC n=1 Tax=Gammaproteobacteria TaxID=1236 RepID=UPI000DCF6630|nr:MULTISPECIES: protease modulator HflC [Gammaproteobacteria]RTE86429.1 protease modulator HflC [Aliidiomarina sp. B3213]TCZ91015.1 protease modulator HflC [Lysobacter sp. N42]
MRNFIIVLVVILALLGLTSLFTVGEAQRGIVIRFGKVAQDEQGQVIVYEPGLHLKLPFIDRIVKLDSRIKTLDGQADRFITSEKKDLIVDAFVKWRITDFATYYLSTNGGNQRQAEDLLTRRINTGLRAEFGSRTIREIVSGERDELMEQALIQAAEGSNDLGIEVLDVRVKQINLPTEVSDAIFNRMRAERQAVAGEHRSEGREQAEIIRADIDARVTVMIADAERQSRQIRGEGDAEAARIYAEAYGQDPEFFAFIRSMEAYTHSFGNGDSMLVISPESDFFRYFNALESAAD